MECNFCNIVNGVTKAEIIYEEEKVIAFLDIKPIHFGHILVIPKKHYTDFLQVSEEDQCAIMKAAHKVTDALVRSLKPDGYNLFSNNGRAAGQSVFHFHLHITPRYFNDQVKFNINLKEYAEEEMKRFAAKIRQEL